MSEGVREREKGSEVLREVGSEGDRERKGVK